MNIPFLSNKKTVFKSVGSSGEEIAANYLKSSGYKILECNFRNSKGRQLGEIDIIAKEDSTLVFVEVKTRKGIPGQSVLPEANITPSKLAKINKTASLYIRLHKLWDFPYRFDAISVYINPKTNEAKVRHLKNIFF